MALDYDLIVIGEGFAGLTCAAEAAASGLSVATFEAEFFGGLAVNLNELHHFPEANGESGMSHAALLAASNKKAGVTSHPSPVTAVKAMQNGFEVQTDRATHHARFVVIATGARLKKLSVPGEAEYEGRGVSQCADCDGPMFADADVVVAGGGEWALQDALLLAQDCTVVHVVHEGSRLQARADTVQQVKDEPRIRLYPDSTISQINGDDNGMTAVLIRDSQGNASEIAAQGLFALVGLEPNSAIAPLEAQRDTFDYLLVNKDLETNVPGLWAIGQVRSEFPGWLHNAVADGRHAAQSIQARFAQA